MMGCDQSALSDRRIGSICILSAVCGSRSHRVTQPYHLQRDANRPKKAIKRYVVHRQ